MEIPKETTQWEAEWLNGPGCWFRVGEGLHSSLDDAMDALRVFRRRYKATAVRVVQVVERRTINQTWEPREIIEMIDSSSVTPDYTRARARNGAGGGAELTRAMQDALADIKKHGDAEFKNYRWNRGVMARAEWRNAAVTAEAPRVLTLEALGRRGLVEEYNEMKYCGHGEYDDWQCWRLVAAGGEDARIGNDPSSATGSEVK